jgi:hypothetical protein
MNITRTQRLVVALGIVALLAMASAATVYAMNRGGGQSDIAKVRAAIAPYHNLDAAIADGWGLVAGLDHCFASDEGGMGIHYINLERLGDPTLDPLKPEALVYHELPNGKLKLGAVEYIVPVDAWEGDHPPEVLGRHLHKLEPVPGVHVWGLHVWLFTINPDGMFADWNPRVSCPGE